MSRPTSETASRGPAVILCNGDWALDHEGSGKSGWEAVAALVDGGTADVNVYPLCSSLSVTACTLGNAGARAIARAYFRRSTLAVVPWTPSNDAGRFGVER